MQLKLNKRDVFSLDIPMSQAMAIMLYKQADVEPPSKFKKRCIKHAKALEIYAEERTDGNGTKLAIKNAQKAFHFIANNITAFWY